MAFWDGELKELGTLYNSFKVHLPDIVKELEQLVRTDDPNVVMLYSRRCLEVIVTDLCETELKRSRKTEPLKGIIDKLNAEEKEQKFIEQPEPKKDKTAIRPEKKKFFNTFRKVLLAILVIILILIFVP